MLSVITYPCPVKAGICGMEKYCIPHITVGCNYLSMSSYTSFLAYQDVMLGIYVLNFVINL